MVAAAAADAATESGAFAFCRRVSLVQRDGVKDSRVRPERCGGTIIPTECAGSVRIFEVTSDGRRFSLAQKANAHSQRRHHILLSHHHQTVLRFDEF
jgi:hypothetical protein